MMNSHSLLPVERLAELILVLRGQRVMLDADVARVYGVSTKRLNEQVKRNRARFPADFMLQLTAEEKPEVVAKCDHLRNLKFAPGRLSYERDLCDKQALRRRLLALVDQVTAFDFLHHYEEWGQQQPRKR